MKLLFVIIPLLVFSIPVAFAEPSNVGNMYWKQEIISPNSFVDIYVHDDDMNKKEYPNFADKFTISVWSDSSPDGLEIEVVETGVYSGIFKGRVFIADSGDTLKNRLVSMPGDTVYGKYVDFTMPDGAGLASDDVAGSCTDCPGVGTTYPSIHGLQSTKTGHEEWKQLFGGEVVGSQYQDGHFVYQVVKGGGTGDEAYPPVLYVADIENATDFNNVLEP